MDQQITCTGRLRTAMQSVGIFTLEDLAQESGVPIEIVRALDAGELERVDARSMFMLKPILGDFSLRWICLGEGPAGAMFHRLNAREAKLIDSYRRLTEPGRTRVDRTAARFLPK